MAGWTISQGFKDEAEKLKPCRALGEVLQLIGSAAEEGNLLRLIQLETAWRRRRGVGATDLGLCRPETPYGQPSSRFRRSCAKSDIGSQSKSRSANPAFILSSTARKLPKIIRPHMLLWKSRLMSSRFNGKPSRWMPGTADHPPFKAGVAVTSPCPPALP
jgi:hypothetical protein